METRVKISVYGVFENKKLIARFIGRSDDECNDMWAFKEATELVALMSDLSDKEYSCRLIYEHV